MDVIATIEESQSHEDAFHSNGRLGKPGRQTVAAAD
jgi:hypothetical protein